MMHVAKKRAALPVLALLALAACRPVVDTAELPPIDDYASWYRVDSTGPVPGHGDTYRIIYANDVARQYAHAGAYRPGAVLVKEIRDLAGDDTPGDLLYMAVMRKLAEPPPGGELDGGWLFTFFDALGDDEKLGGATCWQRCHVQGPIDGAFLDYGRR